MPKYRYYCYTCDAEFFVYHGMSDTQDQCTECLGEDINKLITSPSFTQKVTKKEKVGELTFQHIEDNRKILEEEKKKAREKMYEPS